eukprot:CAMPEP_0172902316 /NCGR_PEP_ID=MMETSP1075-20121228/168145_1 /TAXON_ID=2916 /ORGANISM="Ceratium fusus, Strain PA161109" /LENGTH=168 /DNA_ID=CAMNT_0013758877 /DNA_START=91 /DNA_END=595 /DNA_ORIENTATION=+
MSSWEAFQQNPEKISKTFVEKFYDQNVRHARENVNVKPTEKSFKRVAGNTISAMRNSRSRSDSKSSSQAWNKLQPFEEWFAMVDFVTHFGKTSHFKQYLADTDGRMHVTVTEMRAVVRDLYFQRKVVEMLEKTNVSTSKQLSQQRVKVTMEYDIFYNPLVLVSRVDSV